MNKSEVSQLLATISLTYPKFDAQDKKRIIDAWFWFLADYSLEDIQIALKEQMNTAW